MTVPASTRRAGPFNGNGTATTFPFSFKVFDDSDLLVTHTDPSGVETILALGGDYSVTLNADQDTSPGGYITYPLTGSPLPVGEILAAVGNLPYDQPLDLITGGNYRAENAENEFDRIVMQMQQLAELTGRALVAPASGGGANYALPTPEPNKYIGWNVAGTALENKTASGGGGGGSVDLAADYDWTGKHSFVTGGEPGILTSNIMNVRIAHTASAGGSGLVRSPFWMDHKVPAGVAAFEWTLIARNSNYSSTSPTGDQVCLYGQAYKYTTVGRSFALVGEAKDLSGNSGAGILCALELDLFANGSLGAASRVAAAIVFGKAQPGLSQSVARAAIEFSPWRSDKAEAKLTNGLDFQLNVDNALIRQSNTSTATYAFDFLNGGGVSEFMRFYSGAMPAFQLVGSGGSLGTYVGRLKIGIDGFTYWLPIYG